MFVALLLIGVFVLIGCCFVGFCCGVMSLLLGFRIFRWCLGWWIMLFGFDFTVGALECA